MALASPAWAAEPASAEGMAVPEFDGRLITVPFSFKDMDDDGLPRYVLDAERAGRVARIALAHARLRHTSAGGRKIAPFQARNALARSTC